jgi:hypothetical protein
VEIHNSINNNSLFPEDGGRKFLQNICNPLSDCMRFEIVMVVNIEIEVFWGVHTNVLEEPIPIASIFRVEMKTVGSAE